MKPAQSGPSILIVDDDPAIAVPLAELLSDEGYTVAVARHGEEALDLVERVKFALILLDLRMPRMDGRAFSQGFRGRDRVTPIVLMTAESNGSAVAREIGAIALLTKPFSLDDVLKTVDDVISVQARDPRPLLGVSPPEETLDGSLAPA